MRNIIVLFLIVVIFIGCRSNNSEQSINQVKPVYDEKNAEKIFKVWLNDTLKVLEGVKPDLAKRKFIINEDSTTFSIDDEYQLYVKQDSIEKIVDSDIKIKRIIWTLEDYKELPQKDFDLHFIYRELFYVVEPALYLREKYSLYHETEDIIVEDRDSVYKYKLMKGNLYDKTVKSKKTKR